MARTVLDVRVFREGNLVGSKQFDRDLLRIGRLPSSHLVLDGIARMHAVIERDADRETYFFVDLGSSLGSQVNGEWVDKTRQLPERGTLDLGPWHIEYEIVKDTRTSTEILRDLRKSMNERAREKGLEDWEHDTRVVEEIGDAEEKERLNLLNWAEGTPPPDSGSDSTDEVEEIRVASMVNLSPEFVRSVYALSPEEAKLKAVETILQVSAVQNSLEWLANSNILKQAVAFAREEEEKQQGGGEAAKVKQGFDNVIDHLKNMMVGGISNLVLYTTRAGGGTITEQEFKLLEEQYLKAAEAANSAKSE